MQMNSGKTDAQKVDVAYDLVYWNSDESQNIGSVTDVTTGVEYSETISFQ